MSDFVRLDRRQFLDLVARFPFRRRIDAVHMHHTWRPRRRDYRGLETITAMRDYHVNVNHWSDIAQHVTIDPEGGIWTGRDWNRPPASATGYNGNTLQGPFMFEMIGDFDQGQDTLDGEQRESAIQVAAGIQLRFGLAPETLRFHRDMSRKSCPGTGVDYEAVLREITAVQTTLRKAVRGMSDSWATPAATASRELVDRVILAAGRAAERGGADITPAEEPTEESMTVDQQLAYLGDSASVRALGASRGGVTRDTELTPALINRLRPYLVNLRQGRFSGDGQLSTDPRSLDTMFAGIDRWVAAGDERRRLVLYAHGGLVSEGGGLHVALNHVDWWTANDVYPIYFVWETGFLETLIQMLTAGAERQRVAIGARDLSDVSDWALEKLARAAGGRAIWGAMKRSAERAFDSEGASPVERNGRAVLRRLADLCRKYPGKVELHAVGHSAGSLFQSELLSAWDEMRRTTANGAAPLPAFSSLQLLAPAATSELFVGRLYPLLSGGTAEQLSIFTMQRSAELDDTCGGIYRKSLLYLISRALEDEVDTGILGLQECLETSPLAEAMHHEGPFEGADLVYSPTPPGSERGRRASRSLHHGGFDDDAWTMTSVLCRVVNQDPDQVRKVYTDTGRRLAEGELLTSPLTVQAPVVPAPAGAPTAAYGAAAAPGKRRALCIGIDEYPTAPLRGCVNDARSWERALSGLGFDISQTLVNREATREAILAAIKQLIDSAGPDETLALVYAGHGTEVPDLDSDETKGTNGRKDEAICPVDFAEGRLIIDDDLRHLLGTLPPGVSLTGFFDCCHSESNTRAAGLTRVAPVQDAASDVRPRYVLATPELIRKHRAFRAGAAAGVRGLDPAGVESMRHVVFAACKDYEVALEMNGAGAFTGHATGVLADSRGALSNLEFQERVLAAFGDATSQHPEMDCPTSWRRSRLFAARVPRGGVITPEVTGLEPVAPEVIRPVGAP